MRKLATSRWREAIRSGEVMGDSAEQLKARMGVDPAREAAGLNRGTRNIVAAQGGEINRHTLKDIAKRTWNARGSKEGLKDSLLETGKGLGLSTMFGGASTTGSSIWGDTPQIHYSPPILKTTMSQLGGKPVKKMSPAEWEQFKDLILRHEGDEMRMLPGKKTMNDMYNVMTPNLKTVDKVTSQMAPVVRLQNLARDANIIPPDWVTPPKQLIPITPQLRAGAHADPQVILREFRNSRMLSPQVQEAMAAVRDRTGEGRSLQKAQLLEGLPQGSIPNKKMKALGRTMKELNTTQKDQAAGLLEEKMLKKLPGEKAINTILNKAPGLLSKLKGFIR